MGDLNFWRSRRSLWRALRISMHKLNIGVGVAGIVLLLILLPRWVSAQGSAPTRNAAINVAVMPGQPDNVLAGTLNAPDAPTIFYSEDGGVSWDPAQRGLTENISVAGIAFDPQNPDLVLAGDAVGGQLFRSLDGGRSWNTLGGASALLSPNGVIGEIYAAVEDGTTVFYAGTLFDGVLRSSDGGIFWSKLNAGLGAQALRVSETVAWNGNVYAATHGGLYRMPFGGTSWTLVSGFPAGNIVFSLAADENGIYAGTASGLYASGDGDTWGAVPNFPNTVVYDLTSTGTRLIAGTESGLWAGTGAEWEQPLVDGNPYGGLVYAVTNTARAPRTIYVGTAADWVFRSDDEGRTFYTISTMPELDVRAALATPTPTPTDTPIPTDTPTPTNTPTFTPTSTETPTHTPSSTPTETPVPTDTPLPTETPTETPLPTDTAEPTPTATGTQPPTSTPDASAPSATTVAETVAETVTETPTDTITIPIDIPLGGGDALTESQPLTIPIALDLGDGEESTAAPTAMPTDSPTAPASEPTETVAPAVETVPPAETPTHTPSSTPVDTDTPAPTATPTITPTPGPTPTPIDVAKAVYETLPPVFVGASVLLVLMIIGAGLSVIRGPRDI